ncbi:hypothetical protein [Loktanella sp. SALINAS62]|uniref:hypothetical protein n=1 Tax=Loktanella sp. SALINAS62 TaxID=2706124 RepID=UPI001B8A982D|nr:hypothetical protein [Loktanella sp. SALINAS62]MBS1302520.1 hypothetical protein [Loktanella sp. SALINAS62]
MKFISTLSLLLIASAPLAQAQEKVFGEVGLSYGQTDSGDGFDVDSYTFGGAGAFVSAAGLGVQLGGSFTNVRVEGAADLDTYQLDGHIYGDLGSGKIGAFASYLDLGDLDIEGLGTTDLGVNASAYGIEGQFRQNAMTFETYAGLADIDEADVDVAMYGVGANYDLSATFAILAAYDGAALGIDGVEEDLRFHNYSFGAEYYPAEAPIRVSASIGRSMFEFAGEDESATNFGLGMSYLFGGRPDSSREDLFGSVDAIPF